MRVRRIGRIRRARGGGATQTPPQGSLVLSATAVAWSVVAGAAPQEATDAVFTVANGGPGQLVGTRFAIQYDGTSGWLSLATALVDGGITVTPTVDATGLSAGTETATITITDANASNSGVTVTVAVTVSAVASTILATPATLAVAVVDETTGTPVTVLISNSGGGSLATPTVGSVTGAGAAYLGTPAITGSGPWTLTVTPDATGGTAGVYAASIPILSTGATNTPLAIPVTVTVTAGQTALLALDRAVDDASATAGGADPAPTTVNARSTTSTALAGPQLGNPSYSGDFADWCSFAIAGNTITASYDISGIATAGTAYASIEVTDANAPNTTTYSTFLKIDQATAPASLSVAPTAISRTVTVGGSAPSFPVTVSNVGGGGLAGLGTVTAGLSPGVSWANVTYATGVATVTFTSSALAQGTYATTLQVAASGATNSPLSVPVQLVVQAAASSTYPSPPFALPSFVTHDPDTDLVTGDPFTPTDLGDYTGTVRQVATQAQLQSAFNACVDTDVIEITAPFTITSQVTFPDRSFSGIGVLLRDAATYTAISALTRRVVASDFTGANTITDNATSGIYGVGGIVAGRGASKLRVVGVHMENGWNSLGTGEKATMFQWYPASAPTSTSHECSQLHIDRCFFRNSWSFGANFYCRRGLIVGGTQNIVEKSRFEGFISAYANDSQAIWVPTNCSGVMRIEDNFCEGASENILIGGTSALMGTGPAYASNIHIKRCHLYKRPAWFTAGQAPGTPAGTSPLARQLKNLGEQKSGSQVLWDSCVFENFDGFVAGAYNPTGGQGYDWTVSAKPQNATDVGKVLCLDIQMRNCKFTNSAGKVNIAAGVSGGGFFSEPGTGRVHIHNTWWVNTLAGQTTENRLLMGGAQAGQRTLRDVWFTNVTADCGSYGAEWASLQNGSYAGFRMVDCVFTGDLAYFGLVAQGTTNSDTSCNTNCGAGNWTVEGNVAWGTNNSSRPKWSGTFIAANNSMTNSAVQIDAEGTLTDSRFLTAGQNGGRPGVDGAHLAVMIAGVV